MVTIQRPRKPTNRIGSIENADVKLTILVVSLCAAVVYGRAVVSTKSDSSPGRWTHPCSVPIQISPNSEYREEVSRDYVLSVFISLEEATIHTAALKGKMIAGRLAESEHLIDLLRNVTHEGLPEEINRDTSLDLRNMTSSFKDDYTVLSVLGAFLERSRMDEELFHSGEYVSMYDRIEERHYSAMCSLHGLVASLNGSTDVIIDREDVIPSDFHEESVFARSLRDFVTVNETENFYINLLSKYESII